MICSGKMQSHSGTGGIGGSSDMISQSKIAATLCLRAHSIHSRGKGGGLVLPVVFPYVTTSHVCPSKVALSFARCQKHSVQQRGL